MNAASVPGFTAEASLYGHDANYRIVANGSGSLIQVTPALRVGLTGSAFCAKKANECTDRCRPEDSDCRDGCDALFWCCLNGYAVISGVGLRAG